MKKKPPKKPTAETLELFEAIQQGEADIRALMVKVKRGPKTVAARKRLVGEMLQIMRGSLDEIERIVLK